MALVKVQDTCPYDHRRQAKVPASG